MMLKTDIANKALGHLGITSRLTDLETDISNEGRVLRSFMRDAIDYVLEQHYWTFATRTAVLAKHSDDPENNFRFAYYMPVNSLVIREVACDGNFLNPRYEHYHDQIPQFEERNLGNSNVIFTSVENAHAKYTERLSDNLSFKSYFGRGVAGRLALEAGPALIAHNWPKVMNVITTRANNEISAAIAEDIARSPQKRYPEPPTVRVRYR